MYMWQTGKHNNRTITEKSSPYMLGLQTCLQLHIVVLKL